MDKLLRQYIAADTPKINPLIAEGMAVEHLKHAEQYIHDNLKFTFTSAVEEYPDFPVRYVGISRMTPNEEYLETRKKTNKRKRNIFDLAPSYLYMIRLHFKFIEEDGTEKDIILPLSIPYVDADGGIYLSGARFFVMPVLLDKIFSINRNSIFIRLICDKPIIHREPHIIVIDGRRVDLKIPYSTIYHRSAKVKAMRPKIKANTTLGHYLFAKYGVRETFKRIGVTDIMFGTSQEINQFKIDIEKYHIIGSSYTNPEFKPRGTRQDYEWQPTKLKIAVAKDQYSDLCAKLIASLYYVTDHFPQKVAIEYLDNTRMWKVIMGLILFSEHISEGKLHDDVADHIASLDYYLDPYSASKLSTIDRVDMKIHDIYDLFYMLIKNMDLWLMDAPDEMTSMYGKEYNILYHLFSDIIPNINRAKYSLLNSYKKNMTFNEANNILKNFFKVGTIHRIRRGHGEVRTETCSGDNKAFSITLTSIPQIKANTLKGAQKSSNDHSNLLHSSIAAIGGYLNLPKNEPDGRSRINPIQTLIRGTDTHKPEKFKELLDDAQEKINL